jgi:hypothetical protein
LGVAETELATALAELPKSDRADKAMVTERLRLALAEIVAAKRAISLLLDPRPHEDDPDEDAEASLDAPDDDASARIDAPDDDSSARE